MVEDATRSILIRPNELEDFKKVQAETKKKIEQDHIKYLEQRGYRVVLNNTNNNERRDLQCINILEANGYTVEKL